MADMEIRKSTYDDVYRMLEIFKEAREFMKENGNPNQWGEAYPPKSLLLQDIEEGNSYVCIKDGIIVGHLLL